MAQKALVHNGVVIQVEPVGGDFPVHPSLEWIDADDTVEVGWLWDGAVFSAPPPPPPEPVPTDDEIYDVALRNQRVLKALALALNDGSFVPGSNLTNQSLKDIIKAKM